MEKTGLTTGLSRPLKPERHGLPLPRGPAPRECTDPGQHRRGRAGAQARPERCRPSWEGVASAVGQGQARQEALPPSAPARPTAPCLSWVRAGHRARTRRFPAPPTSHCSAAPARRACLRPPLRHAASCAGAAGNQPGRGEREAAPWRPPPAAHLRARAGGIPAPARPRVRYPWLLFEPLRTVIILTYYCFSPDAQIGAAYGAVEL